MNANDKDLLTSAKKLLSNKLLTEDTYKSIKRYLSG